MRKLDQVQDHIGNSWMGSVLAPTITQPANGATGILVTLGLAMAATPFSTSEGMDIHVATDWEIRTGPKGGGTLRWASTNDPLNLLGVLVPALTLAVGQTYYIRVRYRGSMSGPGAWSADVQITT